TSADIVLLVDSSNSLGKKAFPSMKAFISKMISHLTATPNQYRIALAQYSDDLHTEFLLDTYKAKNPMLNHVKKNVVFKGGSVKTGNALRKVHRTYFKGPAGGRDKEQILVVLTSGASEDAVVEPAKILKSDGVKIIAVGIQDVSPQELQSMATPQFSYKFRTVRDLSMSSQNMTKIIEDVIQINGIIPTDIIESVPETEVCNSVADVVFIVDEGVSKPKSEDIKNFLQNTVSILDVKKNCTKIGLVTYSSEPHVLSLLSKETNRTAILQKIKGFSPREGKANTGAAINATRKNVFSVKFGSRKAQGVEQIAILITHRRSADNISEAARDLRRAGVTVFTIGIENADDTQLTQIASYPQQQYVTKLTAFSDLPEQAGTLQKKLLNQIQDKLYVQSERRELLKTEEADIYVLIDGSTSIHPNDFGDIKKFLKEVVKMFNIGLNKVRFGAVQYSDVKRLEFELHEYSKTNDLETAIDNIRQIYGNTYIGEALTFMQPLFKKAREQRAGRVPCHLIVLTDGESHDSVKEPAESLRNEKVNIYAIGVKDANEAQLHEIAGSENRTFFVHEFDSLKNIKNEIVQGICSGEACKEMTADIMFLVDSSGSIGPENFLKMKNFMRELVNKSDISADRVQVGVIQFSGTNKEEFQLDRYSSKSDIFSAIDRMSLIGETTLTGSALTFVADYFKPPKGARPAVKKILILITDGEAQDEVKSPARDLRDQGVVIYSIGVFNANKTQLEEISGKRELVFYVEKFDILKHIEDEIIFGICRPYEECKRIERLDVVFVIDGSGSISPLQYQAMKDFMIALVKKSDVAPDRVQFGAVKYSDEPETFFYLNEYTAKSEIVEAIQNDITKGGSTYTAKAIDYSEALFAQKHGSRKSKGVPQILIVITDGESHDKAQLADTAKRLRDNGIIIYAVGIEGAKPDELLAMAGSENKYYYVGTFEGLKNTSVAISEKICDDSKPECEIQADLVFLIDGSNSIQPDDFNRMKNFSKDIIDQIDYEQNVEIGIAQYSDGYKREFSLGAFQSKLELNSQIENIEQMTGTRTLTGAALRKVKEFFAPARSRRVTRNVQPVLLVVTDGKSFDDVAEPAEDLRREGVHVYAIGVGDIDHSQLVQIAGVSERKYTVHDFKELKIIKKRLVDDLCKPAVPTTCFVDIVMGFDISSQKRGDHLFHGQSQLKAYLPDILKALTSLSSLSCNVGTKTQSSVAVYLNNTVTPVSSKFQFDSEKILNSLRNIMIDQPSHLNGNFLESLWKTFPSKADDQNRRKVLLVFSDGLDEDVEELEQKSEELRKKGLDALITVALEGASKFDELQYIEFGKGFEYMTELTIGMRNIAKALSKYVGSKGIEGSRGHLGEEGEPGSRGLPGPMGEQGNKGCDGSKGPKGYQGIPGKKGDDGDNGIDGITGEQGDDGDNGIDGITGEQGSPGSRGLPGERGERGLQGDPGNPGLDNDIVGVKGSKGEPGRQGQRGIVGVNGEKGSEGSKGLQGEDGATGYGGPGKKGAKGVAGYPEKPECPVYPTELVFALEISQDVTSQLFERMREIVISVVNATKIRDSNCPVGARVAVVSYNSNTHYLIRFSEFYNKNQLLNKLNNVAYERSSSERDIAGAMRFVAKNVFKRTRQGPNVRKVAVFFSNGPSADELSINTAVLEYVAFDIVPIVLAFNDVPLLSRAFAMDDTGFFQVININQENSYEPLLETFQRCTLCYDKCKPDEFCERRRYRSPPAYVDAAFILDSSQKMSGAEFENVKNFLSRVLDNFNVSSQPETSSTGDRVAVVSHAPPGFKPRPGRSPVKKEFDFVAYSSRPLMKRHIQQSVQQLNGAAALGHAIQWTIDNVFLTAPHSRQHKAIIVISAGETSQWDKEILKKASLRAKCQGYALFVISLGHVYNDKELEELASIPLEHHLVQLGRVHKPELEYVVRFMKPFVHLLRRKLLC
ncbi:Collagen alpha-6(VI) chain, partial [Chelonia mydas]